MNDSKSVISLSQSEKSEIKESLSSENKKNM
jgi:hypothetical protein